MLNISTAMHFINYITANQCLLLVTFVPACVQNPKKVPHVVVYVLMVPHVVVYVLFNWR